MQLDRVDSRGRLKVRRDPYWQRLSQGRHVGFRRMTAGSEGTWLARFYDPEKGYEYQTLGDFATLEEKQRFDAARAAAEAWFQHLDRGGVVDVSTVKGACAAYVEKLRLKISEATADDAKGRFARLVDDDPIGRVKVNKLVKRHLEEWTKRVLERKDKKGKQMSRASFNRNITALRAALNLAHEDGEVASDLAWKKALRRLDKADKRRELYLDRAARRKLISKASKEVRAFLTALTMAPMRPGELASLRVENLDASQRVLRVSGKTGERKIPLGNDAFVHFKTCVKNKLPSAWLVSRGDGSCWDRFAWRDQIREAVKAAKLPAATCAYTLRHSAITDLVMGGLDLFTVAKIAGTSIVMIEKHYGHLQQERARSALDGLALI
jgi:site-specific recombinase XerD